MSRLVSRKRSAPSEALCTNDVKHTGDDHGDEFVPSDDDSHSSSSSSSSERDTGRQASRNAAKQRTAEATQQQDELPPDLWPDGKSLLFRFPVSTSNGLVTAGVLFCSNWTGTNHPVRPGVTLANLVGANVYFRFTFRCRRVWLVEKTIDGEFEYAFEYEYHPSGNLKRVIITRAMLGVLDDRFAADL